MKYRCFLKLLHWTLFVDLLGYRDINGDVDNLEKANELIEFMKSNVELFKNQNDNIKLREHYSQSSFDIFSHYDISFAFISDSLIVSYSPNLELDFPENIALSHSANMLLIILQRLRSLIYKCVLEKKIFLRGGISNYYSYIDGTFAVGKGVGASYIAEAKKAIYPRVVLADDVVKNNKLMEAISWLSQLMYKADLIVDDNGTKYLDFNKFGVVTLDVRSKNKFVIKNAISNPEAYKENIFHEGGMLKVYKEAIEFQIKQALLIKDSMDPEEQKLYKSLREKYIWLSNYHDNSCEYFSNLIIAIPKPIAYANPKTLAIAKLLLESIPVVVAFKIDSELLDSLKKV